MLQSEQNIDELINSVASKGGTTTAALNEFNNKDNSLFDITLKAVKSALERSKDL